MAWNDAVVTNIGMNLLAQTAGGTALTICSAKSGSTAVDTSALVPQNDVSEPKKAVQITGSEVKENRVKISVRVTNSGVAESYVIKQIGLYAKQAGSEEEKLVAVIQDSTGETIPTESENPNFQIDFAFSVVVANAENITVTAASEAYVSVEDFNEKLSSKQDNLYTLGSGNPVVMDGLQGGVPFSEITIDGKNIFDGSLTVGMVATANGTIVASKKYISTTNLISVESNTRYIAQNSENKTLDAVVYFDKNKSVIGHTYTSAAGFNSFTTPDKCSFIMWRYLFDTDQDDTSALTNIQLEEGGAITSYEPPITGRELTLNVNGTEYKITPDSNPYTVPNDIRQLEGRSTLSITNAAVAKLNVTGVVSNKVVEKIWDEFKKLDDSAYTGDAKTLDGKSDSDFAVCQSVSDIDGITESGLYRITSSAGLLLHITWDANYMLQIRNINGSRLSWRTKTGTWGAWSDVADGGNADTVDGLHATNLMTLSADGTPHGALYPVYCKFNVKNDDRFYIGVGDGYDTKVRVGMADDAGSVQGYTALDLIAAAASGAHVSGSVSCPSGVDASTEAIATVNLGFKPSVIFATITPYLASSTKDFRTTSVIINNDTAKRIYSFYDSALITRTNNGFTVNYGKSAVHQGPTIDYIAFK